MQIRSFNYYWMHWAYIVWLCCTTTGTVSVLRPIATAPVGSFVGRMYGELPVLALAFLASPCLQHSWKDFRSGLKERDATFMVKGLVAIGLSPLPIPAWILALDVISAARHIRFGV